MPVVYFSVFALCDSHLLFFMMPSPAKKARRDQSSISRHVELCYPAVGAGDQRGSLC